MQTGQFASAPDAVRLIVAKEGFKGLYAVCNTKLPSPLYGALPFLSDPAVLTSFSFFILAKFDTVLCAHFRDIDHFYYEICPLMLYSSASMSNFGSVTN